MNAPSLFRGALLTILLFGPAPADDFPTPQNSEKATDGPLPPDEVVKTAKLPPGFELSVFAAEPHVQNPIAITTDARGRLWVAENYSWAGSEGGFLPQQRDRIVILEDVDGDGRHNRRTVFWDQAHKLTSIEVGSDGVWAICLPHLLFIPDANRDDVPDGPPIEVLDGLQEGPAGHTPANGLKWGPDGWLYARHGILATSSIGRPGSSDVERVKINTGVWRYHPGRGTVEAVMHGMTNSWGFDFDEHGEMFVINTVIGHLWHAVPGAHVQRMFGFDASSQHLYQLIEQTANHVHWDSGEAWSAIRSGVSDKTSAAGGGHAHAGLMIYQGDNWPAEYRGRVYTLNLHGRRLNCDILHRDKAGYTASHGPDLCFIADPWFRGMDLITGADGGVFIADWSDTGECHDLDGVHRTSGRIYKLAYGKPRPLPPFDLRTQTDQQLIELASHANAWWPSQARRVLADRRQDKQPAPAAGQRFATDSRSLRAIWNSAAQGTYDRAAALADLQNPDEHIRVGALRLLADDLQPAGNRLEPAQLAVLRSLAEKDLSSLVQLYLASALQRLPLEDRWPIAQALAHKADLAGDRMFPLMLWYGIEPAVPGDPARSVELLGSAQLDLVRQNIARRLALEIASQPQVVDQLVALASSTANAALARDIVLGMAEALRGWRSAPRPADWETLAQRLADSQHKGAQEAVQVLNIVFGDGRAIEELNAIFANGGVDPATRQQALRAVLAGKPADFAPALHSLLGDAALATDALRGLALYDHPETPTYIMHHDREYGPAARAEMIATLASRPAYAVTLMQALREKKVTPSEISASHARQILAFEDPDLTAQLTELWGDLRSSAAEKRALIDAYRAKLGLEVLAGADQSAGRALFQKTCANCHVLYGQGRKLGPDLTGSNRKNLDYLLENIVDPSATVGVDFRVLLVTLDDGRVLSGVVSEKTDRTLTLQTAQEPVTIDRQEIEISKQTASSLMPDGLLQNFSDEQVRDLVAYLMSANQVALRDE